jgi:hypothetical protein
MLRINSLLSKYGGVQKGVQITPGKICFRKIIAPDLLNTIIGTDV